MRSKNANSISFRESTHMKAVKSLPCSVCDGPGGYAHHINQGQHFTTIALCYECHQGTNGWHGNKSMWRIRKLDELAALNITLGRIASAAREGKL